MPNAVGMLPPSAETSRVGAPASRRWRFGGSSMNWIHSVFEKVKNHYAEKRKRKILAKKCVDGYSAFKRGTAHGQEKRWQESLDCFDDAIDFGFTGDNVYAFRGTSLHALGFYLDAIDDFNKAIELKPEDCHSYFYRSLCKERVGDVAGRVSDLQDAIRLSKVDSAMNTQYSASLKVQELGYPSVTVFYEMELRFAEVDLEELHEYETRVKQAEEAGDIKSAQYWRETLLEKNKRGNKTRRTRIR
jgi:tetratricopeptide (TPR) repeat protein